MIIMSDLMFEYSYARHTDSRYTPISYCNHVLSFKIFWYFDNLTIRRYKSLWRLRHRNIINSRLSYTCLSQWLCSLWRNRTYSITWRIMPHNFIYSRLTPPPRCRSWNVKKTSRPFADADGNLLLNSGEPILVAPQPWSINITTFCWHFVLPHTISM